MVPFVHLHVHSQYSLLDGQASIDALIEKAQSDGMPGMALTDHGSMFGIKEFYNKVKKKNSKHLATIKDCESELRELNDKDNPTAEEIDRMQKLSEKIHAKKREIFKPILGCECYCARNGRFSKTAKEDLGGWHLIVLAKNLKGYKNLIKMVSLSWTEGFYRNPRIDKELLEKYHEGLIICSACLGGEIPQLIMRDRKEEAEASVLWFKNLFGDDYYLELQRHETHAANADQKTFPKQVEVNKALIELGRKHGVKIIATNDVHFVNEDDAEAHDRLICLSTGKDIDDPARMRYSKQEWLKSTAEMNSIFADVPEALTNTLEILDKVELYSIDSPALMPFFEIDPTFGTEEEYREKYTAKDLMDEFNETNADGKVTDNYLRLGGYEKVIRIKLEADYLEHLTLKRAMSPHRYGENLPEEAKERIDFELQTIKRMGFPGYFLIVQDFITAAREMGVSVGPGRGSAAGSVVAYCLGITDIDPIRYDLLFERFLNPDRISMPDIDIDFDDDGRGEVLKWVTEKYGQQRVAHIITYGTMATKLALKDVARVQQLPLKESNRLAKLVPDKIPDKKLTLKNAIEAVPELKDAANSMNPILRDTLKYAQKLEGNVRNTGVHACGVIIGQQDISDIVPVATAEDKETKETLLVTQYEGSVIEETGLIKMDFLGLKTLSIIKEAVENVKQTTGKAIDMDKIPIDDKLTYELFCQGKTVATFQFESAGMQKYLKELQPTEFEDLIAMNALYRPGPMDYIPAFIARKHGREEITYDIPEMERYLKNTYGITVYQEQVMLLSRLLAGFTRGQSDTLRKAMGKKQIDKMNELKSKFFDGGQKNGHHIKTLEKIWADWEKFASYAFNKSHATCYSWVAYQTAYLKAHYPSEFMAAVLSRNLSNIKEITKAMDECKAMKIQVLGPDINESHRKFGVNAKGDIRFGLVAVKGVGESAVQAIIEERDKRGPYKDIYDFVERVNLSACNKKAFESLALAGAFDALNVAREPFGMPNEKGETFIDVIMRYGTKYQTDKQMSSASLFGDDHAIQIARPEIPKCEPWSILERLNREKELIGIYLSAHPLDEYRIILNHVCNMTMKDVDSREWEEFQNKELLLGGIVTGYREGITKNGKPYGILKIEDMSGSGEMPLFGDNYINFSKYGKEGLYLYIKAAVQPRRWKEAELDFKINSIQLLQDVKDSLIHSISISIPIGDLNEEVISELSALMKSNPGKTQLFFNVTGSDHVALNFSSRDIRLNVTQELLNFINDSDNLDFTINK
ncbi:DNA polymerase III subunit alpha [Tannerella sp.]|uniref:DNA polymerase III subunit alpha n=1 Tax=Tannerella sp. TaxID=2382127 RepID=UPI0026DC2ADC|nr:DNA polymerase III subunit alpha [Tannerella sp.]MDO4704359.1 DNA polymerase III subunit alpha [Tannerella sp.]